MTDDPPRWSAPPPFQAFVTRALAALQADLRVEALAVTGSAVSGTMDPWSDLDLVVFVADAEEAALTPEHPALAARLGPLLVAHRGDHVGEPRLLICLYDPPLLHVDLKFVAMRDAPTQRLSRLRLLWARGSPPALPEPAPPRPFDTQWCADRLPGWTHYLAVKVGRGELYEALDSLGTLRARVLGPLIAMEAGVRPRGLRRLEETGSPRLDALARTVCPPERAAVVRASQEAVALAAALLDAVAPEVQRHREAEARTLAFLRGV